MRTKPAASGPPGQLRCSPKPNTTVARTTRCQSRRAAVTSASLVMTVIRCHINNAASLRSASIRVTSLRRIHRHRRPDQGSSRGLDIGTTGFARLPAASAKRRRQGRPHQGLLTALADHGAFHRMSATKFPPALAHLHRVADIPKAYVESSSTRTRRPAKRLSLLARASPGGLPDRADRRGRAEIESDKADPPAKSSRRAVPYTLRSAGRSIRQLSPGAREGAESVDYDDRHEQAQKREGRAMASASRRSPRSPGRTVCDILGLRCSTAATPHQPTGAPSRGSARGDGHATGRSSRPS